MSHMPYISDIVDSIVLQFIDVHQIFKNTLDLLMNIYYADVEFNETDYVFMSNHVIIRDLISIPDLCKLLNHKLRTNDLDIRSLVSNTSYWVILPNDYLNSKYYRPPDDSYTYDDTDVISSIVDSDVFNIVRKCDLDSPSLFETNEAIEISPSSNDDELVFEPETGLEAYKINDESEFEAVIVSDYEYSSDSTLVDAFIDPNPRYDSNHKPKRRGMNNKSFASDDDLISYENIDDKSEMYTHSEVTKSDLHNYLNDDPSFYL